MIELIRSLLEPIPLRLTFSTFFLCYIIHMLFHVFLKLSIIIWSFFLHVLQCIEGLWVEKVVDIQIWGGNLVRIDGGSNQREVIFVDVGLTREEVAHEAEKC